MVLVASSSCDTDGLLNNGMQRDVVNMIAWYCGASLVDYWFSIKGVLHDTIEVAAP